MYASLNLHHSQINLLISSSFFIYCNFRFDTEEKGASSSSSFWLRRLIVVFVGGGEGEEKKEEKVTCLVGRAYVVLLGQPVFGLNSII